MHDERYAQSNAPTEFQQHRSLKFLSLKIPGLYFLVAALWITLSDRLLLGFVHDSVALTHLQSVKGWVFVLVTAWMLHWLLRRSLRTLRQAESALKLNEERLQAILQQMPVMLDAFDDQGNIITWNYECERLTGYSAAEIIGNPQAMTLLYPDAAYRQQMITSWAERGNNYRHWEWDLVCKDGSRKTIAWSNISDRFPISGWEGWGIGVDVGELRAALREREGSATAARLRNKELLTLHRISDMTLGQRSLKVAFQDIVKEISAATAFPIVAIELHDATRQVMVFEAAEGIPLPFDGQLIEVPVTQTASGTVMQTGQMLVKIYDPSEPKKCDANESLCKLGIKTFICVPMTVNQTTIGVLSLAHPEVVQTDHESLQWLTSLANYVALFTDRKRAEEALRESEAQFRLLCTCLPVGIYLTSPNGYGTYINPRYQDLLGLTLADSGIGDGWVEQVHPDDREWLFQAWSTAAEAEQPLTADYRVTPRKDDVRWMQTRTAPMRADDGTLIGHVGTIEDITDRKQAEQEIQQLNQALEQQNVALEALVEQRTAELLTFINMLPDNLFVIDRQMRFLFCNDQNARFCGLETRQQVEGKTIFELFPPEQAATFAAQNQQVFASSEMLHFQAAYDRPQGTLHTDTYKIPLKHPNGEVYGLIGAARDVTELAEARQALSDRTTRLEIVNRELESFSYSVSHDLRAPLRHINGFVAALKGRLQQNGHLTDSKIIHYLQIIQNSSQKMEQLIDGLLTLSRLGRRQMARSSVDLNQVVAAVLAQRPEHITAASASEVANDRQPVQFITGDLPTVTGDATLLQQVFVNLVDNAIKFSHVRETSAKQNHHPAQVEINSLSDGTIFVRDRGVGFQMEYADQLFGAFQRLHSQSEFEGTGIGLAIVQRIIHRHGGTIWAESQPGQGATFYFKLD